MLGQFFPPFLFLISKSFYFLPDHDQPRRRVAETRRATVTTDGQTDPFRATLASCNGAYTQASARPAAGR